jgi:hypothetical protein
MEPLNREEWLGRFARAAAASAFFFYTLNAYDLATALAHLTDLADIVNRVDGSFFIEPQIYKGRGGIVLPDLRQSRQSFFSRGGSQMNAESY